VGLVTPLPNSSSASFKSATLPREPWSLYENRLILEERKILPEETFWWPNRLDQCWQEWYYSHLVSHSFEKKSIVLFFFFALQSTAFPPYFSPPVNSLKYCFWKHELHLLPVGANCQHSINKNKI
jgi:hypothetical protein